MRHMLRAVRGRGLLAAAVVTAIAVVAAGSAASAPQALSYSRLAASGFFAYTIEYGSHPDSTFNGSYQKIVGWEVNAIAVYDGRSVSVQGGRMLTDSRVSVDMNMTEWRAPPAERRPIRCRAPGSRDNEGQEYFATTNGGRFSGGGGLGVTNAGLTVNPGRAVSWSIGCAATESLESPHGLPGGPSLMVPAPPRSLFGGTKAFSISCRDSYSHGWEPAADVPNAHTFRGNVEFRVRFTPFPASEFTAAKKRLRDGVGRNVNAPSGGRQKDCP